MPEGWRNKRVFLARLSDDGGLLRYANQAEARKNVIDYIVGFYNCTRLRWYKERFRLGRGNVHNAATKICFINLIREAAAHPAAASSAGAAATRRSSVFEGRMAIASG